MREMKAKEEIKIGGRVKIREDYFDKGFYHSSLKGRVGIVVDGAGNDDVLVLFPGWRDGHNGNNFSKLKRDYGNMGNTCFYIPLDDLELVHDGFEIGDTVEYETADGYKTGTVVDFNIFNGDPLVEFLDTGFAVHDGNGFCVTKKGHSAHCLYCDPERLSPKVSKSAASVSVSARADGTIVVTISRGQKVEIVSL